MAPLLSRCSPGRGPGFKELAQIRRQDAEVCASTHSDHPRSVQQHPQDLLPVLPGLCLAAERAALPPAAVTQRLRAHGPPQVWTGSGPSSCSSQGAEGTRRPSLGRSTAGQPDHGPSSEEVSDLYQQVFAAFGVHCHRHRQRRSGPFISRGSQVRSRLDRSHQPFLSRSFALLSLPTNSAPCAPLLPPLTHLPLPVRPPLPPRRG